LQVVAVTEQTNHGGEWHTIHGRGYWDTGIWNVKMCR
jgi:hypothetical protein